MADDDSTAVEKESAGGVAAGKFARDWKTTYQPSGGKWHLMEVQYRVQVRRRSPVAHSATFLTTAIDTAGARTFYYVERAQ